MGLFDILLIIAILIFPMLVLLLWKRTYLAYPVSVLAFWFLLIAHPASYLFESEADNHLGFVMSLYFGLVSGHYLFWAPRCVHSQGSLADDRKR